MRRKPSRGEKITLEEKMETGKDLIACLRVISEPRVEGRCSHGRKEKREYWITEEVGWITGREKWQDLRSIGMVYSRREIKGKVSEEYRYYLSSLKADAGEFARAVRGHWGIENNLHWVLDVCFREDECRVRSGNTPENLAILRRLALNLLKHTKHHKRGIKVKMKRAGWDNSFLTALLKEI